MTITPPNTLQRAIDTATKLLTEPVGGATRPAKHFLLCCGGPTLPHDMRQALASAARGIEADIAYLEFGRGSPV